MQDKQRLDAYVQAAITGLLSRELKHEDETIHTVAYNFAKGMMDYVDAHRFDGWTDNNDGKLPVEAHVKVIVMFRNKVTSLNDNYSAGQWRWTLEGHPYDIIKWKLAE